MDYEIENIELRNALKLAHARIKDLEEDAIEDSDRFKKRINKLRNTINKKDYRIKELEAQVDDNSEELCEDEFGQIMYK
jgi:hypothetical protein